MKSLKRKAIEALILTALFFLFIWSLGPLFGAKW